MSVDQSDIEFLSNKRNGVLSEDVVVRIDNLQQISEKDILRDVALYQIQEISFQGKIPRREAVESILGTVGEEKVNFIYLILGESEKVSFYYGVSRDYSRKTDMNLSDVGKFILDPAIKSNFRGSRTRKIEARDKKEIIDKISAKKYFSLLDGVSGYGGGNEQCHGLERLANIMMGSDFGYLVIASGVDDQGKQEIESNLYETYVKLKSISQDVDKDMLGWIRYLENAMFPRLDYGLGKGIFVAATLMFADKLAQLKKLENMAISLYSGERGNKVPLKAVALERNDAKLDMLKKFQFPGGWIKRKSDIDEIRLRSVLSQYIRPDGYVYLGSWISADELAMRVGLPQKDVVGLELREEVEFGLNTSEEISENERICLGNMVQSGYVIEKKVFLDKRNFNKHMFITGVTGSGKTTTCQKLLIDSGIPFLVIEPAKTEYRRLCKVYEDLLVFTLGKDTVAPFRLNPFELFRHESITSRVDMIMASIQAAFHMEAAIPQLIESAIYQCYEDYGWNIASNENWLYGEKAFNDGVYAFPTVQDLVEKIDKVVDRQGFGERLKSEYIGSIKARLLGLLVGAKGLMLNTRRSIDFEDLLSRRVVLEFEEIRSAEEKSLVMGFVLANLMAAIRAKFMSHGSCQHVTVMEEAHRLLRKSVADGSSSEKHGIELFSDMLAEVRKYGEALVIVDQIPNKLTPDVLKNTNTKIIHRLFAVDDKDAVGNTVDLNEAQKRYLSHMEDGRAIVFAPGFHKAVQVWVTMTDKIAGQDENIEDLLFERACQFYMENYKKGIFVGTQIWKKRPSREKMIIWMELSREVELKDIINCFCENIRQKSLGNSEYGKLCTEILKRCVEKYDAALLGAYLSVMNDFKDPQITKYLDHYEDPASDLMEKFVKQCVDGTMNSRDAIEYWEAFLRKKVWWKS